MPTRAGVYRTDCHFAALLAPRREGAASTTGRNIHITHDGKSVMKEDTIYGAEVMAMKWGFGYSSRQLCACQRAVRCTSMGW
jgi:hydrogenase maturation factor HypF (carbamoyltransferase family)